MSYKELIDNYKSKKIFIASIIVPVVFFVLIVLIGWLIVSEKLNISLKNFNIWDFIIMGLVFAYFSFIVIAAIDIIRKVKQKITINKLINKMKEDKKTESLAFKLTLWFSLFMGLSIIALIVAAVCSTQRIWIFAPYERKIAPPGVGTGIPEAHTLNFT